MKVNSKYLFLFCLALLLSCKEKVFFGYDFFPIEEGLYKEYEIMNIFHDNPSLIHDTTISYLKTVIGEKIIDLEGDSVNKFYRYEKSELIDDWVLSDVWVIKRDAQRGEIFEENSRVIKMIFPTNDGSIWDINALNISDFEQAEINNSQKNYNLADINFSTAVRVNYDGEPNLAWHKEQYQIYAENIGLIHHYKKDFQLVFATPTPKLGAEFHQILIGYGKE
jgi:hypothetical protein